MKKILIALFLMVNVLAFSQKKEKLKIKVDRKNDLITVNGTPLFKYENKTGSGTQILNMNDEEVVFVIVTCYYDTKVISDANPKGRVCYKTFDFTGIEEQTEIGNYGLKGITKILLDNDLYVDGKLNKEQVLTFIKRNGKRFSAEQLK